MKKGLFLLTLIFTFYSCNVDLHIKDSTLSDESVPIRLIEDEMAGVNCENGGKKVIIGRDMNKDGVLDSSELSSVAFVCNEQGVFKYISIEFNEPEGTNCKFGGKLIEGGLDLNSDGILGDNEVQNVEYLCNDGPEYVLLTENLNEPIGSNCELGGIRTIIGLDTNMNGILDDEEISESIYGCNQESDFEALVRIIDAGAEDCALGGAKILAGLDINRNGILDDSEVIQDRTILDCLKLEDFAELARSQAVDFGSEQCAMGGEILHKGRDLNSNSYLDDEEIISSTSFCKSDSDFNRLILVEQLPVGSKNCSLGGKSTITGLDYNYNSVLDDSEIEHSATILSCYSSSDYNTLVFESNEPAGSNCLYGGTKTEKGLDFNHDGILSSEEIDTSLTNYSCLGTDDFNTLVIVSEEPFGSAYCSLGGKKTEKGLDLNNNGIIDYSELDDVSYECYAPENFNLLTLMKEELSGSNCALGGTKVEQGRDYNNNGILEAEEIDNTLTSYKCFDPVDFDLLTITQDEPKGSFCSLGGVKVQKGRDYNLNSILDAEEFDNSLTEYICTQSFEKSKLSIASKNLNAGSTIQVNLTLVDESGVELKRSGIDVKFEALQDTPLVSIGEVTDNGNGTYSAIINGIEPGGPVLINAFVEGLAITTQVPELNILAGKATQISIEDKPDGRGKALGLIKFTGLNPLKVYAVSRDANGFFVANEAVEWSVSGPSISLSNSSGASTSLQPGISNGSASVFAKHPSLGSVGTEKLIVELEGLVASFSFEDDTIDSSGNGNNAINKGAVFVDAKIGKGVLFDGKKVGSGSKSYYPHLTVIDNPSLALTESGTISAWIRINRYTDYAGIVMKGNQKDFKDEAYALQFLHNGKNKVALNVKDKKDNPVYSGDYPFGSPINTEKWFHVVGVWDANGRSIYIDGVRVGFSSDSVVASITTGDLHIGSQIAGQEYPNKTDKSAFVGIIDELTIWNRALSVEEILLLYNSVN